MALAAPEVAVDVIVADGTLVAEACRGRGHRRQRLARWPNKREHGRRAIYDVESARSMGDHGL